MQVLVHADHTTTDYEALTTRIDGVVASALKHFIAQITRLEVHLSDENGAKSGPDDKRCMMEARLQGRQPVAVTHHAATIESAVHGAALALAKVIEGVLGRSARTRETLA